jgi:hypothetical protein
MIRLLTYASLGYAAVLVLALAAVLLTIWVLLLRINALLARVKMKLSQVAESTAPLRGQLGAVTASDALARTVDGFVAAAERRAPPAGERRR